MADDIDFADLLGPALSAASPLYDVARNRGQIGQLLGGVKDLVKNPIQAHIEQEQAKRVAGQLLAQHAAEVSLGINPQTGLPVGTPSPKSAPAAAAAPADAPAEAAAPALPPTPSRSGAAGVPASDGTGPTGPYAQSPSMLPGTDPEEIAAAKRAADKHAADAKFAADEQEIKDAIAQSQKAGSQNWLQRIGTNLLGPGERQRQLDEANAPLKALMDRREALSKLRTDRAQQEEQDRGRAVNDPDSEITQTSRKLALANGVKTIPGFTASMLPDVLKLAGMSHAQQQDAQKLMLDQRREAEVERQDRARNSLDWAKLNADKADANAKAAAGKPIDEKTFAQAATTKDLPEQIKDINKLQADVGLSKFSRFLPHGLQFGAQEKLQNQIDAVAPGLIPAIAPNARGATPEMIKAATDRLTPKFFESPEEYAKKTGGLKDLALQRSNTKLDALAAAGANPAEIAQLRPAQEGTVRLRTPPTKMAPQGHVIEVPAADAPGLVAKGAKAE